MIIEVRYDKVVKKFDIPKEKFDLMVETDYQKRLAEAKTDEEKAMVKYRTPQEIMKELNDEELSSFRRYHNHLAIGNEIDGINPMDLLEDPNPEIYDSEYEDTCNLIRGALKQKQADIIISVIINGKSLSEYASEHGWSLSDASHRLSRAKKNLKNFLKNRQL